MIGVDIQKIFALKEKLQILLRLSMQKIELKSSLLIDLSCHFCVLKLRPNKAFIMRNLQQVVPMIHNVNDFIVMNIKSFKMLGYLVGFNPVLEV